ncbi:MAG: AAA family ATPase [Pseudobdellovibrio sp.]
MIENKIVDKFQDVIKKASEIILDKNEQISLVVTCLLAKGHLLIEDEPGVGKTTLAQTIAKLVGLSQKRIQFTNDLLPSDILGQSVFNRQDSTFFFKKGPLFSEIVIADELNRANPKTQSALLQAMEEGEVSTDQETIALPEIFFLMATQNPRHQIGTYPLPESQVDRFLMCLHLDYISESSEVKIFMGENPRSKISQIEKIITHQELVTAQKIVSQIHISAQIASYVAQLLNYTRKNQTEYHPLSTRTGLALISAAKATAFLNSRDYVTPDDLTIVIKSTLSHRLAQQEGLSFGEKQVEKLLQKNPITL